MRAKDAERFGKSLKPKEFLKGYLKPKKISAEMEADPREGFLRKAVAESIATGDGGTMWPAIKGSLRASSTWTGTGASLYGGTASGSGWSGGLSSTSFGSSFTYKSYFEECGLSDYHQDILMKAICDKIATEGVAPAGSRYITFGAGGLGVTTTGWTASVSYDET